jgi:hypothetical protein
MAVTVSFTLVYPRTGLDGVARYRRKLLFLSGI